jgi:hypothetical protein
MNSTNRQDEWLGPKSGGASRASNATRNAAYPRMQLRTPEYSPVIISEIRSTP